MQKTNKILVLGTGAAQADFIAECKKNFIEVHACSYKSNDPGEKSADYFSLINITDKDKTLKYAEENNINYIYTVGSDIAMPTVSFVAEKLGLRSFCSEHTTFICNHKTALREFLGEDFEGNLRFRKIKTSEEPFLLDFPFIMKPTDSQGQRGVFLINDKTGYDACFDKSIAFSRENAIIIEEYVEGGEVSVNTYSVNGEIVFSIISDRTVWNDVPGGIIHKHTVPSKYVENTKVKEKINSLVKRTLKKLRIENGPAYFQIIIDKSGNPKLIEVSPRLDGCHMWRLIKYSTGVNLLDLVIRGMQGNDISVDSFDIKPYELEFYCSAPGVEFKKSLFETEPYEYIQWYYNDGDTVKKMNGYKEKCGYVIRKISKC